MKFERLYVSTITGALVTLVDGREREIEAGDSVRAIGGSASLVVNQVQRKYRRPDFKLLDFTVHIDGVPLGAEAVAEQFQRVAA